MDYLGLTLRSSGTAQKRAALNFMLVVNEPESAMQLTKTKIDKSGLALAKSKPA